MAKYLDETGLKKVLNIAKIKIIPSLTLDQVTTFYDTNAWNRTEVRNEGFNLSLISTYFTLCYNRELIIPLNEIHLYGVSYDGNVITKDSDNFYAAINELIRFFNYCSVFNATNSVELFGEAVAVNLYVYQELGLNGLQYLTSKINFDYENSDYSERNYPLIFDVATVNSDEVPNKETISALYHSNNVYVNPFEGKITATLFKGDLEGQASEAYRAYKDINGNIITSTYATKTEVSNAISSVFVYKGTVSSTSGLPSTGNNTGDVWHVTADASEYVWDGTTWLELGTTVDMTNYVNTVTTSGTGNVITGVTKSNGTVTLTKGYMLNTVSTSGTGNAFISASTSNNTLTLTKGYLVSSVTTNGSGNAITSASTSNGTLTLMKGSTFSLSNHTHTASDITDLTAITTTEINNLF